MSNIIILVDNTNVRGERDFLGWPRGGMAYFCARVQRRFLRSQLHATTSSTPDARLRAALLDRHRVYYHIVYIYILNPPRGGYRKYNFGRAQFSTTCSKTASSFPYVYTREVAALWGNDRLTWRFVNALNRFCFLYIIYHRRR